MFPLESFGALKRATSQWRIQKAQLRVLVLTLFEALSSALLIALAHNSADFEASRIVGVSLSRACPCCKNSDLFLGRQRLINVSVPGSITRNLSQFNQTPRLVLPSLLLRSTGLAAEGFIRCVRTCDQSESSSQIRAISGLHLF